MKRRTSPPRLGWQQRVESQGLLFHSIDDLPYWDESVHYEFTPQEVDLLERATYELDKMCLGAVEYIVDEDLFDDFGIPRTFHDYLRESWARDEVSVYGRFDLAFDGQQPPKLLEYNADTPTSLLEAAVIQWFWLREVFPLDRQFNGIHERLIEAWQRVGSTFAGPLHFAGVSENLEDFMTVEYLRDCAVQAGLKTSFIDIAALGWNADRGEFVDQDEQTITTAFKLYPWEWMMREEFGLNLAAASCRWLEPPWKSILSNKALLSVLWDLYPDSPYLLETAYEPLAGDYVRKPLLSREGANIRMVIDGRVVHETTGPYTGPTIYQRLHKLPQFDGRFYPVIGSWMINGWACGIGIREDEQPITGNTSRFVPHRITND